jgi:hypothetical protein
MKELRAAIALSLLTLAFTRLALSIASPVGQISLQLTFIDLFVIPLLVSTGLLALALSGQPKRTLYKVPLKLAAILFCLYGSSLIIPGSSGGVMALAPYCLVTVVLLLVVFW